MKRWKPIQWLVGVMPDMLGCYRLEVKDAMVVRLRLAKGREAQPFAAPRTASEV